jgi:hypothetical protein
MVRDMIEIGRPADRAQEMHVVGHGLPWPHGGNLGGRMGDQLGAFACARQSDAQSERA